MDAEVNLIGVTFISFIRYYSSFCLKSIFRNNILILCLYYCSIFSKFCQCLTKWKKNLKKMGFLAYLTRIKALFSCVMELIIIYFYLFMYYITAVVSPYPPLKIGKTELNLLIREKTSDWCYNMFYNLVTLHSDIISL